MLSNENVQIGDTESIDSLIAAVVKVIIIRTALRDTLILFDSNIWFEYCPFQFFSSLFGCKRNF